MLFILVFSCSTEEVQDTTPPPSIIQTPQPEPETEDETQTESENQPDEQYFPVNIICNGTYQRSGSPYPPLYFNIDLISGNKNNDGNFSKGSIIRLLVEENPGWEMDYSLINDGILDQDIQIEDSLEIKLDVLCSRGTFPYT